MLLVVSSLLGQKEAELIRLYKGFQVIPGIIRQPRKALLKHPRDRDFCAQMQEETAMTDTELFANCVSGSQGLVASALYPVPEDIVCIFIPPEDTSLHLLAKLHERAYAYMCMNTCFTYACACVNSSEFA